MPSTPAPMILGWRAAAGSANYIFGRPQGVRNHSRLMKETGRWAATRVANAIDQTLAAKAAAGDRASFALLASQCYDLIHRMAWRITGSVQDAEDIAQDVCLKLAHAIKSWRGDCRFETWLYRLTYTTAIDQIRAHKRFALAEADNVIALFEGQTSPSPDAGADHDDLWAAVRTLPPQQRDAVVLVYAEERTHAEAADIMGCTEKTVSWHLHEARKRLKIKLEAHDAGGLEKARLTPAQPAKPAATDQLPPLLGRATP
jgi:RNA polymerase sigma-70 factor, ECF subfamily